MQNHNFKIVGGDTDSIMFCKPDMSPFSKEEQEDLLEEINALLPKEIKFANDGIFPKVIYLATKNYIMIRPDGKIVMKGSSLKSSTLEPIMKEFINEIAHLLLADDLHKIKSVYEKYRSFIDNIQDIGPWCSKKSLSPTTYNSERKNETDIIDAIAGSEYVSGDRIYVYTQSKVIETGEFYKVGPKKGQPKTKEVRCLKLKERWANDYDKKHYYKRLDMVFKIFKSVLGEDFLDK